MYQHTFHRLLKQAGRGRLKIEHSFEPESSSDEQKKTSVFVFDGQAGGRQAHIRVLHPQFYRYVLLHGDVGFGEAYFLKYWSTDSLVDVLSWFMENAGCLFSFSEKNNIYGWFSWPLLQLYRVGHLFRRNTIANSRKNIAKHYDLSNEFYSSWLSEEMAYSSGSYENAQDSLAQAQQNKFEKIAAKLELNEKDHVLEIGCGWGGFSTYIANKFGCKITAVTISPSQYQFFLEKISRNGLKEKIDLQLLDYRKIRGRFSKIVSIEMIEAVGLEYYHTFFRQCSQLLSDDGVLVLQCITFPDCYFSRYLSNYDYIREYIFPGSALLSLRRMLQAMEKTGTLYLYHLETLGPDYARTLAAWSERVTMVREKILNMGFSEEFIRKWTYYLAYCEVGFAFNYINDIQMVLTKVKNRNLGKYKKFFPNTPLAIGHP